MAACRSSRSAFLRFATAAGATGTAPPSQARFRHNRRVLIATWVLAVATAILALSVPVVYWSWLGDQRERSIKAQREREEKHDERLLERARKEFMPKSWLPGVVVAGLLTVALWWSAKFDKQSAG